jgi:hypothetical protein
MRGLVSKLPSLAEVFKGRYFDAEIIGLCVRWYLRSRHDSDFKDANRPLDYGAEAAGIDPDRAPVTCPSGNRQSS